MNLYLNSKSTNPYFNLATEEYLLKSDLFSREDIFMLWQNEPTVVLGKHQNTYEEIDNEFVKANNIHVVRRLSGGGAVYHDKGNLNFTFIKRRVYANEVSFEGFAKIIITALKQLGISTVFSGRNDILIEGRKFSGNAQYSSASGLLHHGTILVNSDFEMLARCLRVKEQKYISKGVKSVQKRVANIQEFVARPITTDDIKMLLAETVNSKEPLKELTLSAADLKQINELADKRYHTWEWNYGSAPKYNFKQEMRFSGGMLSVFLQVKNGLIIQCGIFGDFFAKHDIEEISRQIINVRHEETSLKNFFAGINAENYFYNISLDELVKVFSP
jgi:lipoate-protein ligase A